MQVTPASIFSIKFRVPGRQNDLPWLSAFQYLLSISKFQSQLQQPIYFPF